MRADGGGEARLPCARLAHRAALPRVEHRDEKAGERDGERVRLHLDLRFAEQALALPAKGPSFCAVLTMAISAPRNATSVAPRVPQSSATSAMNTIGA